MLFEKLPNKQAFKHLKTYAKSINVTPKKITSIDILPYLELLKKHTPNLTGKKIVLDCANGASKYLAKQVFDHTNANIIVLNTKKGKYINKNCGAVHPEALSAEVIKQNADIGFAFDGDADRCVCVLSDGRALSGDNALVGIAKYYKFPQIVGTIYSNGAIERVLKKEDITFHRSNVGDQAVKKLMNKTKCVFGGERSGHFIFSEFLPTGDGMFSALKIATIKNFEKSSQFKKTPTITINFPSKNKKKDLKKLTSLEKKYLSMLGKYGRIIIRPSGTENLIRVLIEHKNIKTVEKVEALLKSKFTTK
jgi:phosphoglucosamine mutase